MQPFRCDFIVSPGIFNTVTATEDSRREIAGCIKGIPDMKEYYAKYNDRIEFVGIDCRDTEEKWKEGVAKHELPWTNLYNGDGQEIVIAYGVQGYPTKIIIDPEGKIVEAFLGEDPALYKKLDELF